MRCQRCQRNEAEVHVHALTPRGPAEIHLCRECAGELAVREEGGTVSLDLPLGQMLLPLLKEMAGGAPTPIPPSTEFEEGDDLACETCGITWRDVRLGNWRLGCPECYEAFGLRLRLQFGARHIGRAPEHVSDERLKERRRREEISSLRRELTRVLASESYERAAEIRDRLRVLGVASENPR